MKPIHVFFFRGLSTYGLDSAVWSVFNFGPVYRHFAAAFARREIHFHPVLGMGAGNLPEITARAKTILQNHPIWQDPNIPVHFFGHSAGGLIARLLIENLEADFQARGEKIEHKIASYLSLSTPHHGAKIARLAVDMPQKYKGSTLFLKMCGYNVLAKRQFFEVLTRERVEPLFRRPNDCAVPHASIICAAPRDQWCIPLRLFYLVKALNDFKELTDGVVDRDSQAFGRVLAEIPIDHFRQVGLFGAGPRFRKMCDFICDHYERIQPAGANPS